MTKKETNHLLTDIKEFVQFLTGLWGILSSFTVLFPFSNALINAIPVLPSNLTLFTTISTMISIFGVLFLYSSRDDGKPKNAYLKQAFSALGTGILSLALYLYFSVAYQPIFPVNSNLTLWLEWIVSITLYVTIFSALSTAFTSLAILEYLEQIRLRDIAQLSNKELMRRLENAQEHIKKQSIIIAKLKQPSTKNKQHFKFKGEHGVIEDSIIEQEVKWALNDVKIDIGIYDTDYINPISSSTIKISQFGNLKNINDQIYDKAIVNLLLTTYKLYLIPQINENVQYQVSKALKKLGINGEIVVQFVDNNEKSVD